MSKFFRNFCKCKWVLVILLSVACISISEADTKAPAPQRGGELITVLPAMPKHLNLAIQSGIVIALPGVQLYASPLRFDDKWNPQPYLAEKWEMSPDGLSLTLHLVKGATFHDGKPITSKDVAFSIMTIKKNHPFQSMFAPVERVETPDPNTAILRLSKPHAALLTVLSPALCPIIPSHIFDDGQDIKTHPANNKPIGSGPFKLKEYLPGKKLVLERYDAFFIKGRPYLDKITFLAGMDSDEVAISLESGKINLVDFMPETHTLEQSARQPHLLISKHGYEAIGPVMWLAFNLKKKPLNDLRVRHALAYATNREFIAATLYKGKSGVETGPISNGNPFYTKGVELYPYNIDKANQLLDEAGYPRDQTGKRFTLTFDYTYSLYENFRQLADYLHQEWMRNIGVETQIRHAKGVIEWADRVSNGDFDITIDSVFNYSDPVVGVHRTYLSSNIRNGVIWSNTQGYESPEADALMEQASTTLDFAARKGLYVKLQQLLVHDLPVFWISNNSYATIYHKDLMNVNQSVWGPFSPFDEMYWKNR